MLGAQEPGEQQLSRKDGSEGCSRQAKKADTTCFDLGSAWRTEVCRRMLRQNTGKQGRD